MSKIEKSINLAGQRIAYTKYKRRGTRYLRISVSGEGAIAVAAPWHINQRAIDAFLREKAAWIFEKLQYFQEHPEHITTKGTQAHYRRYKEEARARVHARLRHYNQFYQLTWQRIAIRNQKTCWGSCSVRGNLSFNYKVALLPERLADYVIVHELCHLRELNHSPKFWRLVAHTLPDYAALKKELRTVTFS